jgi:hypothetical protein
VTAKHATLRHVESGEWRLGDGRPGEDADSTPWTDRPATPDSAPDLWGEDSPDTWRVTQPWRPRRQADTTGATDRAGSPGEAPAPGYGSGAYPTIPYGPASYGQGGYAPAPASVPYGPPSYGQPQYGEETAGPNGYPPAGLDQRSRTDLGARHRSATEQPGSAPPPPPAPPPPLGRVLGLTAGWYAIPTVAYLFWLIALSDDRPGSTGSRQLSGALPWLVAAIAVSLALCVLLRRVTVGWRSLGVSFAAAVIGAGLATMLHSFAA